ncbi:hypothetical protein NPX79_02095 [Spiroplasma endosymbiont of Anurida maritima]|uniref:hypothetical protein n=1 Tax=Spiroplasma endosymbiont of Anurida maritima TaxID=2967972 RepID=UPI0036D41162
MVAVIVGVISPSVQFLTKSNRLENNSGTFDGIFNIESSASNNNTNFQDNVVKKYYVDNVDWDNKKILKDNTIVDKTWFYENIIGDKIRSDTYITTNIIAKSLYPLFLLQPKEYNNVVKGLGITEEGFNYFKDNNFNFDYRIEMLHRIFKDVKGIEIVQNKAFFLEPLRGVSDLYYYINSTENININNLSYKNSFNKMHLFSGQKSNQNEIIINGKWAINNNIKVNEALDINNYKYKVSGLGSTLDAMIKTTKKSFKWKWRKIFF